jgi:copper transport protein
MLLYAVRSGLAWRATPAAAQGIIRLYSTAAAWLFGLVLITGVISALVLVPLGSLFTTAYGLFLIAKAVIVGVAAGLALAGRAWLRRPSGSGAPALVTRIELCALAAVLAITGILTVLTPPGQSSSGGSAPPPPAAAIAPRLLRDPAGSATRGVSWPGSRRCSRSGRAR